MQCPNCGNVVPDSANVCGYCGYRLNSTAPLPAQPAPVPVQQYIPQPPPPPKSGVPGWVWGLVAGVAFFAVLAVAAVLILPRLPSFPGANALPSPTRFVSPADTARPTNTSSFPAATNTRAVPAAGGPSATFTNQPDSRLPGPIAELFPGAVVVKEDDFVIDFTRPSGLDWHYSYPKDNPISVFTGAYTSLMLKGGGSYSPYVYLNDLPEGQAVLVTFRVSGSTPVFAAGFRSGGADASFRKAGVAVENFPALNLDVWSGNDHIGRDEFKNFSLNISSWYSLFLGMGDQGTFSVICWENDHPENRATLVGYNLSLAGDGWTGKQWSFSISSGRDYISLAKYTFISLPK